MIYERSHQLWTEDVVDQLLKNALLDVTNGVVNITELTELLKRSKDSVRSRITLLRKMERLPKKRKKPKGMKFIFRLHNISYQSKQVEKIARECFKDMSFAAEFIYQNGMTVIEIRRGLDNPENLYIENRNLNNDIVKMKVENQKAYILSENILEGWKEAIVW